MIPLWKFFSCGNWAAYPWLWRRLPYPLADRAAPINSWCADHEIIIYILTLNACYIHCGTLYKPLFLDDLIFWGEVGCFSTFCLFVGLFISLKLCSVHKIYFELLAVNESMPLRYSVWIYIFLDNLYVYIKENAG